MSDDDIKDVFKEALKEWMDEKFAKFGKWTLGALGVIIFGFILKLISSWHGF